MLKLALIFLLASVAIATAASPCTGCIEPLKGEERKEARKLLVSTLKKVAADNGPNYRVAKMNKATAQVVQGYLYRYNVDLTNANNNTTTCKVKIWEFMKDITVTIVCPGKNKLKKGFTS